MTNETTVPVEGLLTCAICNGAKRLWLVSPNVAGTWVDCPCNRAEQPRPTEAPPSLQKAQTSPGKADAGLAGDIAELALAADFGGNDIAGLRQGIIGDAAIQAFVDAIAALTADGVAAENEACAALCDARAAMYRSKGARHSGSNEDTLSEYERFEGNAVASEYAAFEIRARMGDG